jgi:hypothetical protein
VRVGAAGRVHGGGPRHLGGGGGGRALPAVVAGFGFVVTGRRGNVCVAARLWVWARRGRWVLNGRIERKTKGFGSAATWTHAAQATKALSRVRKKQDPFQCECDPAKCCYSLRSKISARDLVQFLYYVSIKILILIFDKNNVPAIFGCHQLSLIPTFLVSPYSARQQSALRPLLIAHKVDPLKHDY